MSASLEMGDLEPNPWQPLQEPGCKFPSHQLKPTTRPTGALHSHKTTHAACCQAEAAPESGRITLQLTWSPGAPFKRNIDLPVRFHVSCWEGISFCLHLCLQLGTCSLHSSKWGGGNHSSRQAIGHMLPAHAATLGLASRDSFRSLECWR